MTYGQAKTYGYRITDAKFQRGYVSRKINLDEQEVKYAGGKRKGQPYVVGPYRKSTQYCIRYYLTK